jgi:hypothetical protein
MQAIVARSCDQAPVGDDVFQRRGLEPLWVCVRQLSLL